MIKRKYKIYESWSPPHGSKNSTSNAMVEFIGQYPNFNNLQEGLDYINKILDPGYTGKYGIVEDKNI